MDVLTHFRKILADANLEHRETAECQKKWRNILIRYREIQTRVDVDSQNKQSYTEHWPFYLVMHNFATKGKRLKIKRRMQKSMGFLGFQDEDFSFSKHICGKCGLKITTNEIKCEGDCQNYYHLSQACTEIPHEIISNRAQPWICKKCVITKREYCESDSFCKENNVWNNFTAETDPEIIANELNLEDFTESLENEQPEISNNEQLHSIKFTEDLSDTYNDNISDLKCYLKYQENNFEQFNHEILELQHENQSLKLQIEDLEVKHHHFDQLALRDEIEIVALPQYPNENLIKLFLKICSTLLDIEMHESSIIKCFRTPQRYNNIPNIVVKLKDSATKKLVLKNHKGKYFSSLSLGILPGKIFYINERLTQYYSDLYKRAKELKKMGKIKQVWVDNGRILVRKDDVSRVRILDHLNKINEFET